MALDKELLLSPKKLQAAHRAQIKRFDKKTEKRIANLNVYIAKIRCDIECGTMELENFAQGHADEAIFREIINYLKNGEKSDCLNNSNFVRELRNACIRCCCEEK